MILSKRWNKIFFYCRLCFNFWFPILRNSLHVFPKTEQLWNAIFVEAIDTTFVVSKRWWWTSSDGNDFANTFDIKLISLLITFIFLPFLIINFLYYICPRKRKCKSDYLYNDPREALGIPIFHGGGESHSREVWVEVCPVPGFQTLPLFNPLSSEYPGTSSPDWCSYISLNS